MFAAVHEFPSGPGPEPKYALAVGRPSTATVDPDIRLGAQRAHSYL